MKTATSTAFANDIARRRIIVLSELRSIRETVAQKIEQVKAKSLAQRLRDCPVDAVEDDAHEFFAVCVSKGQMTNRTSL